MFIGNGVATAIVAIVAAVAAVVAVVAAVVAVVAAVVVVVIVDINCGVVEVISVIKADFVIGVIVDDDINRFVIIMIVVIVVVVVVVVVVIVVVVVVIQGEGRTRNEVASLFGALPTQASCHG